MSDSVPSVLTSRFAKLNPFSKSKGDDENLGDVTDASTVAGGGHAARQTAITKDQLRVSQALKAYLVEKQVLSPEDADVSSDKPSVAIRELLDKSHVDVPRGITDRSFSLPSYYISSSHNTYLLAHQLYGSSSATAYETALRNGARCVEIDAWDHEENPDEPKVTHGYTLASSIPFRSVCEAIRDVVDEEAGVHAVSGAHAAPIMLSLENHCGAHGQMRLATIMREVWGDRLLSKPVRDAGTREEHGTGEHVTLAQLGSKIAVMVEYHFGEEDPDQSSSSEEDGEEDEAADFDRRAYRERKQKAADTGIIPELAELGVYCQSVKPQDNSWFESKLKDGPHHHLINISESGLNALMPAHSAQIAKHDSQHLMRVYPKGTRINSGNLNPVTAWSVGAQVAALNWQTFDASLQLNEALFAGTDGYVLKPSALRSSGSGSLSTGRHKRLRLHVAGATDIPIPEGHEANDVRPYLTCTLLHPHDFDAKPAKRKTSAYHHHKLGIIHKGLKNPPNTDPIWDEVLEWEYEDNELVFLRLIVKSDDKFARNPMFAVAAVRMMYVVDGYVFIRMLDLKGRETHCSLLVRFEIVDA